MRILVMPLKLEITDYGASQIYCPQKVGVIGTQKNLEIKFLICRKNNFVFGYSNMSASFPA